MVLVSVLVLVPVAVEPGKVPRQEVEGAAAPALVVAEVLLHVGHELAVHTHALGGVEVDLAALFGVEREGAVGKEAARGEPMAAIARGKAV